MSNFVHLDVVRIVRETAAAFLVLLDDDSQHWIPKSQVSDPDDYQFGDVTLQLFG